MKRTTAEGNVSNRYTEGNPSLGIPATVVGAEEMNNLQEEIANVVEDAGLTLNGAIEDQMLQAIKIIMQRGGTQIQQSILNNQATPVNVTGALLNKVNVKGARYLFSIQRVTDTNNRHEIGELYLHHNSVSDTWHAFVNSHDEDAGVVFSITAAGQVQYTSSNLAGASYAGTLRLTQLTTLAQ